MKEGNFSYIGLIIQQWAMRRSSHEWIIRVSLAPHGNVKCRPIVGSQWYVFLQARRQIGLDVTRYINSFLHERATALEVETYIRDKMSSKRNQVPLGVRRLDG